MSPLVKGIQFGTREDHLVIGIFVSENTDLVFNTSYYSENTTAYSMLIACQKCNMIFSN